MKIEYSFGDALKDVNPKNVVIPYKSSVYEIKFDYTTSRNNNRSGKIVFLYSDSVFQDINANGKFVSTEAVVMNVVSSLLRDNIEQIKRDLILKDSLVRYIEEYNMCNPHRKMNNVRDIKVTGLGEYEWNFNKGTLSFDMTNICLSDVRDVVDINTAPIMWSVSLSFMNNRGNKKSQNKFFLTRETKEVYKNEYTGVMSAGDKSCAELYKQWIYFSECMKSVNENKNRVSNVKILDTKLFAKAC